MENLHDIQHRSRTIKEIRHITNAMKMLSAIRVKQSERRVENARPFARKINEVLVDITELIGGRYHPLMEERKGGRSGMIILTSDRGLCGSFNDNVIKTALRYVKTEGIESSVDYLVVGKSGKDYFSARNIDYVNDYIQLGKRPTFGLAQKIANDITSLFLNKKINQAFIVYSKYISSAVQKPRVFRLLPMIPITGEANEQNISQLCTCTFEPSAQIILGHLVPRYVETEIYRGLLESDASENSARLTAMEAATDNADKIIDNLSKLYNRSRQSLITKEISEIVGGVEALNQGEM